MRRLLILPNKPKKWLNPGIRSSSADLLGFFNFEALLASENSNQSLFVFYLGHGLKESMKVIINA